MSLCPVDGCTYPQGSACTMTGCPGRPFRSARQKPGGSQAAAIAHGGSGQKLRVLDLFSGYTIREDGLIVSRFGRAVKPHIGRNGYARVELWENGKGRKHLLHRLVARAFVPNPTLKPDVNHIDGIKANNLASNLEWVTQSENQLHAYRIGLQRGYRKPTPLSEGHKAALCGSRWRGDARTYHAVGLAFDCPAKAAAHFGVNRQTFYNRAASPKHPDWFIEVRKEVEG